MSNTTTHTNQTGMLAEFWCKKVLPLTVLKSAAGFYIGTLDEDGLPCSRESNQYFATEEKAQKALTDGGWTQKQNP